MVKETGIKTLRDMTEEERKAILGPDYEAYKSFSDKVETKKKTDEAKTLASAMISPADPEKGTSAGKFYAQWAKLQEQGDRVSNQMDGIWGQAYDEACGTVGLRKPEPKE